MLLMIFVFVENHWNKNNLNVFKRWLIFLISSSESCKKTFCNSCKRKSKKQQTALSWKKKSQFFYPTRSTKHSSSKVRMQQLKMRICWNMLLVAIAMTFWKLFKYKNFVSHTMCLLMRYININNEISLKKIFF